MQGSRAVSRWLFSSWTQQVSEICTELGSCQGVHEEVDGTVQRVQVLAYDPWPSTDSHSPRCAHTVDVYAHQAVDQHGHCAHKKGQRHGYGHNSELSVPASALLMTSTHWCRCFIFQVWFLHSPFSWNRFRIINPTGCCWDTFLSVFWWLFIFILLKCTFWWLDEVENHQVHDEDGKQWQDSSKKHTSHAVNNVCYLVTWYGYTIHVHVASLHGWCRENERYIEKHSQDNNAQAGDESAFRWQQNSSLHWFTHSNDALH